MTKSTIPFEDPSDLDSIATDSTKPSENGSVYYVDKILTDRPAKEGLEYLVLWEGYPIHQATWEPEESLEKTLHLPKYKALKEQYGDELPKPFDIKQWEREVQEAEDERLERIERRLGKRARRSAALKHAVRKAPVSDQPVEPPRQALSKVKIVKTGTTREAKTVKGAVAREAKPVRVKKGIARKISPRAREVRSHSSQDSLINQTGEISTSEEDTTVSEARPATTSRLPRDTQRSTLRAIRPPAETTAPKKTSSKAVSKARPTINDVDDHTPGTAVRLTSSKHKALPLASRKTASSLPAAPQSVLQSTPKGPPDKASLVASKGQGTKNALATWTAQPVKKKSRSDRGFANREKAPTFDPALVIDTKTGKRAEQSASSTKPGPSSSDSTLFVSHRESRSRSPNQLPTQSTRRQSMPSEPKPASPKALPKPPLERAKATTDAEPIRQQSDLSFEEMNGLHPVYRRRTPAPPERQRSVTPPEEISKEARVDLTSKRHETCWYWSQGGCRFSAEDCEWAHEWTSPSVLPDKTGRICKFWLKKRRCLKGANCGFSHDLNNIGATTPSTTGNMSKDFQQLKKGSDSGIEMATRSKDPKTIPGLDTEVLPLRNIGTWDTFLAAQGLGESPSHQSAVTRAKDPEVIACEGSLDQPSPVYQDEISDDLYNELKEHLLKTNDIDRLIKHKEKHESVPVFLVISTAEHQLSTYRKLFKDFECSVYDHTSELELKDFNKKHTNSCLIFHPDEEFWTLPGLFDYLNTKGGNTRAFRMGFSCRKHDFVCERIFPHSGATFIYDFVLMQQPEKAAKLIMKFVEAANLKPQGAVHGKIVTRPGLKPFLEDLIQSKAPNEAGINKWLQLYHAVCQLCPIEDEDPHNRPHPKKTSHLVSIDPEMLPSYSSLPENDLQGRTEVMVEWFAGWSVENAGLYRKFVTCHENFGMLPQDDAGRVVWRINADDWRQKYTHIAVIGPDEFLALKKVGK